MSHEKEGTAETTQKNSFWSTKITGISLPLYLLIVLILIVTMALGKLPKGILGPLAVLVIFGNLFHFLGNKIPIIKSYLGGGSVFAIFASAALATFNILPHAVLQDTSNFINNMGFLDFYIAALITGSILGMDRDTLIKASVRFIPVALIAMVSSFFAVGFVGMLIGNGFGNSVLYISLPAMAGGVGAGAVPLSSIYAHVLGTDASQVISRLIPATAMTNVLAIIGAALLARAGESKPGFSGQGKLVKTGSLGDASTRELKLNIPQFGVGLMVAMSFFMLGQIANYFAPKVHAYAFMIIIVVLCKVFNILPKYYEDAAVMFNQLVVKNLTAAVLAGIGMALLNLNVLVASLTWQFVVLCLVSVISISVVAGFVGRLFGLYPVEASITAGFCNNSMGGTGNVAVLSASKRMELIAFAQMGNRLGGAIVLIISGFIMQLFS
ncbi:2-hydroxycarboxylate transporter family protein [Enterococcus italicus]|uniref:2-hydroxycarboxylate transporter family protein n=1 Tax=Enterococcus italicus TaxID=246144 RepID=UPI002073D5CD|nr:2-hydroxycarboxylate transporter family protein [Enterococcus italicus]MCM6932073.1 2-hydroxycarboxylate transporter family protein [Enterococcus italicus]